MNASCNWVDLLQVSSVQCTCCEQALSGKPLVIIALKAKDVILYTYLLLFCHTIFVTFSLFTSLHYSIVYSGIPGYKCAQYNQLSVVIKSRSGCFIGPNLGFGLESTITMRRYFNARSKAGISQLNLLQLQLQLYCLVLTDTARLLFVGNAGGRTFVAGALRVPGLHAA